ncbi:MAG: head GIN domain-containing protein [Pseudomonadota bacterium]
MKPYIAAVAATALSLSLAGSVFAGDRDDKTPRDVVATYDFAGFDEIEVMGVYELDIRAGDTFSVRTEATRKEARYLNVELDGRRLVLDNNDDENKNWGRNNRNSSVLAIVTLPKLASLEVTGVATGTVSAFTDGDVDVEIAGVGDLTLAGRCDRLDIEMAGVGSLDAQDLVCAEVEATMGGVGEMSVHATERIEADSGGIGEIEIYGNPSERDVDDGFMSKVRFR